VPALPLSLEEFQGTDKALEFFKVNATNYPTSPNVYSSLAKAYEIKGDKELAIRNLEKSLELNPNDKPLKKHLQKVKKSKDTHKEK
jgi:tetratricopeptide (TPR) repeat protein